MIIYKVRILSGDIDAFINVCSDGRIPVLTIASSTAGMLYIVTEDDYPIGALKADFQLAEFTRTVHGELQLNFLQSIGELDRVRGLEDANEGLRRDRDRLQAEVTTLTDLSQRNAVDKVAMSGEIRRLEGICDSLRQAHERDDAAAREHLRDEEAMLSAVEYHKRESEDRLEDLLRMTAERDKRNADALAYLEERNNITLKHDALMVRFGHLEQELKEAKVNNGAQLVEEPAYVIFDVEGVMRTHHRFKSKQEFYEFMLRRAYAWRSNDMFTRGPNIEAKLVKPRPDEIGKFVPVED